MFNIIFIKNTHYGFPGIFFHQKKVLHGIPVTDTNTLHLVFFA